MPPASPPHRLAAKSLTLMLDNESSPPKKRKIEKVDPVEDTLATLAQNYNQQVDRRMNQLESQSEPIEQTHADDEEADQIYSGINRHSVENDLDESPLDIIRIQLENAVNVVVFPNKMSDISSVNGAGRHLPMINAMHDELMAVWRKYMADVLGISQRLDHDWQTAKEANKRAGVSVKNPAPSAPMMIAIAGAMRDHDVLVKYLNYNVSHDSANWNKWAHHDFNINSDEECEDEAALGDSVDIETLLREGLTGGTLEESTPVSELDRYTAMRQKSPIDLLQACAAKINQPECTGRMYTTSRMTRRYMMHLENIPGHLPEELHTRRRAAAFRHNTRGFATLIKRFLADHLAHVTMDVNERLMLSKIMRTHKCRIALAFISTSFFRLSAMQIMTTTQRAVPQYRAVAKQMLKTIHTRKITSPNDVTSSFLTQLTMLQPIPELLRRSMHSAFTAQREDDCQKYATAILNHYIHSDVNYICIHGILTERITNIQALRMSICKEASFWDLLLKNTLRVPSTINK